MRLLRTVSGAGALVALIGSATLGGTQQAHAQPALNGKSVTVTVANMTPTTPTDAAKPHPLTITLQLTNNTDETLYHVRVDVERDAPVAQESLLEQLMDHPRPSSDPNQLSQLTGVPVPEPLPPHGTESIDYKTTTSSVNDQKSVCLCHTAGVYPLNFTAYAAASPDAGVVPVGFGQTYLPWLQKAPRPVQVSWVWPLIDRPHRLADDKPFLDDGLAAAVSPGGRLYRALAVVQHVAPKVRLTLVIDPELIDELATMADGKYLVEGADGKRTEGVGSSAARAWLTGLQGVVASTQVSLTPYADPDMDALSRVGLTWKQSFGAGQVQRVAGALGIPAPSDVAWPSDESLSSAALQQVISDGASIVLINDKELRGGTGESPRPDALAPLPAAFGASGALAAVTDTRLQHLAGIALASGGTPTKALPELVADLAVRAVQAPGKTHYAVIAADRYVNPDPATAERVILETARTGWSTSLSLSDAAKKVQPVDHGQLVEPAPDGGLSAAAVKAARDATNFMNSFSSAVSPGDASALVGALPQAIQRVESAGWRGASRTGVAFAAALDREVGTWRSGIYIARPSSGSYTLASNDAPLPITVINTLPVDLKVRVRVATVNGVAGLSSDDTIVQRIPRAQSPTSPTRSTLKIQTHVQRAGSFQVTATLLAPDGSQLSSSVPLSIHCTALGIVGVTITLVAGGVLVLALAYRVIRRIRSGGQKPQSPGPAEQPAPAGVGA